jgi:glycerate dehydrogenase
MKIVVLDGYTLNPGDLSWRELERLGEVEIYDRSKPEEAAERATGAEILLTNKTIVSKELIYSIAGLKYIGVLATGFNVVDVTAAKDRGVVVTNVPAYSTPFVAQHTFALILELCNRIGLHDESVKNREWQNSKDFSYWKSPLIELAGKTLGIIGLGKIGSAVADIALSFGMKVIAVHKHPERDKKAGIEFVSMDHLCAESDFISLHCPLNAENKGFIDTSFINKMKPSAFLINTSRGALINEGDFANALNNGKIAGAAVDVLSMEPPSPSNPLLGAKNIIITPHIAWASKDARQRLLSIAIENIQRFREGNPQNVVS